MLRQHWPFVAAVGLQALIVSVVAARPGWTLLTGRTVILQTAPVDPYNVMSGYHVALSYEISDPRRLPGGRELRVGSPVHVSLREDVDGIWRAERADSVRPAAVGPGTVVIEGRCDSDRSVVYGIESYFVPEGKGREIERELRRSPGEARAEVKVDAQGRSALVRLHVAGKTYDH